MLTVALAVCAQQQMSQMSIHSIKAPCLGSDFCAVCTNCWNTPAGPNIQTCCHLVCSQIPGIWMLLLQLPTVSTVCHCILWLHTSTTSVTTSFLHTCCGQLSTCACRSATFLEGIIYIFNLTTYNMWRLRIDKKNSTTTRYRHGMCTAKLSTGQAERIRA